MHIFVDIEGGIRQLCKAEETGGGEESKKLKITFFSSVFLKQFVNQMENNNC